MSISSLLLTAAIVIGTALIAYPSVADYWNSFHQTRAIMSYTEKVAGMENDEYDRLLEEARLFNRSVAEQGIQWKPDDAWMADYQSCLDITGTGNMGYLRIEKIGVMLPVYHGTEDNVLQTSVGHLAGTSLPVGCGSFDSREGKVTDPSEGAHSVLSGHRGLPSARLLTDLDKLTEGDTFTLNILDDVFTYEVDQIRIVLPTDVSEIQIEPGKDLCTLVTCTPYGINTHRLLVRGHRIANAQGDIKVVADALQIAPVYIIPFIAGPIIAVLLMLVFLRTGNRSSSGRRKN